MARQQIAHMVRQAQHPLTNRHLGKHVIDQVGGGLCHSPARARRADCARLSRVRNHDALLAGTACHSHEASRQNSTVHETLEFAADVAW